MGEDGVSEGSDSDCEYEIRRLSQNEDLIIDGETIVDDMLVAQRIAEHESRVQEALLEEKSEASSSHGLKSKNPTPTQKDVSKLLRLLNQVSKLSKGVSNLPNMFNSVVGEEVKAACAAAAAAVESLPVPAPTTNDMDFGDEVEEVGEEKWEGTTDAKAALDAVDLQSTSSEDEADVVAKIKSEAPKHTKMKIETKVGDEEVEEKIWEDDDGGEGVLDVAPMAETEPCEYPEDNPPLIRTEDIPERLTDKETIERIGVVQAIVDDLVVALGDAHSRTLDLQSIVCLESRVVLGVVVDVFGPVFQPHYLIFPTGAKQEIDQLPIGGDAVFAAIDREETSFLCDTGDVDAIQDALRAHDTLENGSDDSEGEDTEEDNSDTPMTIETLRQNPAALTAAALRAGAAAAAAASGDFALPPPPAPKLPIPPPPAATAPRDDGSHNGESRAQRPRPSSATNSASVHAASAPPAPPAPPKAPASTNANNQRRFFFPLRDTTRRNQKLGSDSGAKVGEKGVCKGAVGNALGVRNSTGRSRTPPVMRSKSGSGVVVPPPAVISPNDQKGVQAPPPPPPPRQATTHVEKRSFVCSGGHDSNKRLRDSGPPPPPPPRGAAPPPPPPGSAPPPPPPGPALVRPPHDNEGLNTRAPAQVPPRLPRATSVPPPPQSGWQAPPPPAAPPHFPGADGRSGKGGKGKGANVGPTKATRR